MGADPAEGQLAGLRMASRSQSHVLPLQAGSVAVTVDGEGPPLVMLHANPGTSQDFDAVIESLSRSFRIYRPDWPGYGQSSLNIDPRQVQPDTFVTCLEEMLDMLGLVDVVLLGSSLGGYAALRVGLASPERVKSLILAAPAGFTRHTPVTRAFCRMQGFPPINRRMALPFASSYLKVRNDWTKAVLNRTAETSSQVSRLSAALWRSFGTLDATERLPQLKVPAMLIWGRQDPVAPLRSTGERAQRSLNAPLHVLSCGHFPYAELPNAFSDAVLSFTERSRH